MGIMRLFGHTKMLEGVAPSFEKWAKSAAGKRSAKSNEGAGYYKNEAMHDDYADYASRFKVKPKRSWRDNLVS